MLITGVLRSEDSFPEVVRGRHGNRRTVREIQCHRLRDGGRGLSPRNLSVSQKMGKARKIDSPLESLERNVALPTL